MGNYIKWSKRPIGELLERVVFPVDVKKETVYQEIGIRSHCKGIFHKPYTTGKKIGKKRVFWVEPECFIYNIIFAWEQAIAITSKNEKGMIASHRFPMYKSVNGQLLPEYAFLYFSSLRGKYALGLASPGGAGRNKTLGQEEFKKIKIPVPPVRYQKLTVDVIRVWDQGIEVLEKLIAAKQKRKKGLMQQLLTGKKRFKEFNGQEWKEVRLNEFGSFSKGAGVSKAEVLSEGVPAIRYGELYTSHNVEIKSIYSYINQESCTKSKAITSGDILFAGSGETAEEIGKSAVYLGKENAYAGGDIIIFSPEANDSLFLAYLLNSAVMRRKLNKLGQGNSVVHIYKKNLEALTISLPYFSEQQKIALVLNTGDREIEHLCDKLEALKNQKKGLMQKLLTGKIRVKI